MEKRIILAYPRGFCAGVRRALETVDAVLLQQPPPVYVFHEIVHNDYIVNRLRERDVIFVESLDQVPRGGIIIFSAHGVSSVIEQQARERGLRTVDATCPLVKKIHHQAVKFQNQGYTVILIGHRGHPEISGTLGQMRCPAVVIETVSEVAKLPVYPAGMPLVWLSQTTLALEEVAVIAEALRRRYPDIEDGGGICYATQNRQEAIRRLCPQCRLLLVIGSPKSSNSNRLKELSVHAGTPALLINGPEDIPVDVLPESGCIGITAGASAPETLVNATVRFLQERGWSGPEEFRAVEEKVHFTLPPGL